MQKIKFNAANLEFLKIVTWWLKTKNLNRNDYGSYTPIKYSFSLPKYNWRYSGNAAITKRCLPAAPKGEMRNITKTSLFKYIENFTKKKNWKFSDKNSDIFRISAQNIDCGYSLEPPGRGGFGEHPQSMFLSRNKKKVMYTPLNPSFTI